MASTPDVTAPTPLSIEPVPSTKVKDSAVELPAVRLDGAAAKEVIVGTGTTTTVAWAVTVAPASPRPLLTVKV